MGRRGTLMGCLLVKPEGKMSLGRLRCRWMDIIRADLREVGWGDVD
jgi:hypothetical protein